MAPAAGPVLPPPAVVADLAFAHAGAVLLRLACLALSLPVEAYAAAAAGALVLAR